MTTIVASDQICVQITRAELQKSADTCQWFTEEINIPLQALVLLEQYASLTSEEVIPHVSGLVSNILHLVLSCLSKSTYDFTSFRSLIDSDVSVLALSNHGHIRVSGS